jgi:hypothetical protein
MFAVLALVPAGSPIVGLSRPPEQANGGQLRKTEKIPDCWRRRLMYLCSMRLRRLHRRVLPGTAGPGKGRARAIDASAESFFRGCKQRIPLCPNPRLDPSARQIPCLIRPPFLYFFILLALVFLHHLDTKLAPELLERTGLTSVLHVSSVDDVIEIFCTPDCTIENVDRAVA